MLTLSVVYFCSGSGSFILGGMRFGFPRFLWLTVFLVFLLLRYGVINGECVLWWVDCELEGSIRVGSRWVRASSFSWGPSGRWVCLWFRRCRLSFATRRLWAHLVLLLVSNPSFSTCADFKIILFVSLWLYAMDLCCNLSSVISWVIKRLSVVSYFNPINCIEFNFLSILWRIITRLKEKSKKYEVVDTV